MTRGRRHRRRASPHAPFGGLSPHTGLLTTVLAIACARCTVLLRACGSAPRPLSSSSARTRTLRAPSRGGAPPAFAPFRARPRPGPARACRATPAPGRARLAQRPPHRHRQPRLCPASSVAPPAPPALAAEEGGGCERPARGPRPLGARARTHTRLAPPTLQPELAAPARPACLLSTRPAPQTRPEVLEDMVRSKGGRPAGRRGAACAQGPARAPPAADAQAGRRRDAPSISLPFPLRRAYLGEGVVALRGALIARRRKRIGVAKGVVAGETRGGGRDASGRGAACGAAAHALR